ncbi:hypothetical protein CPB86DRAFT_630920 [Serendipita vermifera]|nr:hypothetical protein CPB86DRAFT_630920 [Serendipita vermifera]
MAYATPFTEPPCALTYFTSPLLGFGLYGGSNYPDISVRKTFTSLHTGESKARIHFLNLEIVILVVNNYQYVGIYLWLPGLCSRYRSTAETHISWDLSWK